MLSLIISATLVASVLGSPANFTQGLNFMLEDDWYTIPTADGRMELQNRQQIMNQIKTANGSFTSTTKYFLHTRKSPQGVSIVVDDGDRLIRAGFNASHPVRITIHGWLGDKTSDVNPIKEYLQLGEFNHIVVDWSVDANTILYAVARNKMPVIAKDVARLASFLVKMGSSYSKIYTIGHSLGAHMAALVGKNLEGKINACICIDPPWSLFESDHVHDRVSPGSCKYVEVIHTSFLGIHYPIGDSDFYPNGGIKQPGCFINFLWICTHSRGPKLFKESLTLNHPGFRGKQCSGIPNPIVFHCKPTGRVNQAFREPVITSVKGCHYFKTRSSSPF